MDSPKKLKINNSNDERSNMKILQLDEVLAWLETIDSHAKRIIQNEARFHWWET
jgi:hypothetical protein